MNNTKNDSKSERNWLIYLRDEIVYEFDTMNLFVSTIFWGLIYINTYILGGPCYIKSVYWY